MDKAPVEIIRDIYNAHKHLTDEELMAAIESLPPIPDEDDPDWDDELEWDRSVYPFLGLLDVASERNLESTISLFLNRACLGDPGETMRGICHSFEAIVEPEYDKLLPICADAAKSNRAGTRYWSLFQLARLRDEESRPIFEAALNDPDPGVQDHAHMGLSTLK